ncbi:MAG: ABC transporter permease subunit [Treponema sp.]|jgi:NitT/TauT family transport system permease protein|nr:ABC transporter permease subunit [Treponema sp.]
MAALKSAGKASPLWFCAGTLILIIFWEIFSRLFGSELIFPGPLPVFKKLLSMIQGKSFYSALGMSFARALAGIIISAPLGCIFGIIAGLGKRRGALLQPFFSLTAAVPVMSVILICFLFLGAEKTPVFTAFLMVFPVMAAASSEGVRRVDPLLKEMFRSYKMSRFETLIRLYIPETAPFVLGGLKSSLSLSWKVIVAAEVLVQPYRSIGAGMQEARARLETAELFAWTIAAVAAAALTQGLLSLILYCCSEKKRKRGYK